MFNWFLEQGAGNSCCTDVNSKPGTISSSKKQVLKFTGRNLDTMFEEHTRHLLLLTGVFKIVQVLLLYLYLQ